jgi:nondiscriminating aspartyl-tRNA synthetase
MERTLITKTVDKIGQKVTLKGYVHTKRDHGKLTFIDLRDRSGFLQLVGYQKMSELSDEDIISVTGTIKERNEKTINPNLPTGKIELDVEEYELIAKAGDLPFPINKENLNVELPTLLDNRALTLRHPKIQAIFKVQAVVIDAFREYLKNHDFFEFQAPSIAPETAEGGSEVFEVNYFGHKAYLSQSPQLYKQIAMSAFERVFSVNKIFRAEPSVTTRHLTEVVSLDVEMGFIDSWIDVKNLADSLIKSILETVQKKCSAELAMFNATIPDSIPETPTLSLREVQQKIFDKTGRDPRGEKDLNPEDERDICRLIKEETGSDLVFVYGFPTRKKPFYVYPDPKEPEFNEGMDLLCRGIEWLSGGRRINDYQQLLDHVRIWNMDPEKITMFLDAFKYGVPPEGGFAFGAERITMQILGLNNIREAAIFPRDMERIDFSLKKKTTKVTTHPYQQILKLLETNGVSFSHFTHEPVFTSETAAKIRNTPLHQGAKALVLDTDKGNLLFVLPADLTADLDALKKILGLKKISLSSKETVFDVTGLEIGSIPPLGSVISLKTYLDSRLGDNEKIIFNAARHDRSIEMTYEDYLKIEKPEILNLNQ